MILESLAWNCLHNSAHPDEVSRLIGFRASFGNLGEDQAAIESTEM